MSGGLPKLNMGAVKDKEEKEKKEKKTMAEKARKLGRQASAKLKRGLTPRGSRVDREASFDSLDEASRPTDSLTGALGPRDSSLQGASDSESDAVGTPMSDSAPPPQVQAPPVEHEQLPQFEAAPDAGVSKSPGLPPVPRASPFKRPSLAKTSSGASGASFQDDAPAQASPSSSQRLTTSFELAEESREREENGNESPIPPLHLKFDAAADKIGGQNTSPPRVLAHQGIAVEAVVRVHHGALHAAILAGLLLLQELEKTAPLPTPPPLALAEDESHRMLKTKEADHKEAGSAGAAVQHTLGPPKEHAQLPQFEDAGEVAAAAKAFAAPQEIVPAPEPAATQSGPDAPVKESYVAPAEGGGRNKWKDIGIAVAVFALAAVAAEPALGALRRRKDEVPTPSVDVKAARKSSWGFS